MARYYGLIGFIGETEEISPGIWKEVIQEREYFGDIIEVFIRNDLQDKTNPNVSINNKISILTDDYINNNIHRIRYATFMGSKWSVSNVNVQYPRLILSLGELYNDG